MSDFERKFEQASQARSSTRLGSEDQEREEEERLKRVLEDIESYQHLQQELDSSERNLTDHNAMILEAVQREQVGRDDEANEIEVFAK